MILNVVRIRSNSRYDRPLRPCRGARDDAGGDPRPSRGGSAQSPCRRAKPSPSSLSCGAIARRTGASSVSTIWRTSSSRRRSRRSARRRSANASPTPPRCGTSGMLSDRRTRSRRWTPMRCERGSRPSSPPLPEATATLTVGVHLRIAVRGKLFGWFMEDHHGDGRLVLEFKAPPGVAADRIATGEPFYRPSYGGARGWLGIALDRGTVDWEEIETSLEMAYRAVAPKTLRKMLDEKSD